MSSASTAEHFQAQQFGNYVLVSLLGRGGMAEVYKARSQGAAGFERVVCVKRVLRQHCEDEHFLTMFVNEAKISARLSHPNIVQVYELGEVEGEFFMAMEFVHGRDLLRVMKAFSDTGPLPMAVAAYIAREMCRALAHAHDHKGDDGTIHPIIHRDISPQNVMISFEGMCKVVDFGIAKASHMAGVEETRTGALKGKFAYMAPEQLDGQKASPVSDIFAVGVVLHEMLTGRRLFKGNTDYDTLVRVKTQVVPPPSSLNGTVPADLDQIVQSALNRDPAQRYQRANQMARDLEVFCGRVGFTSDDMKDFMGATFPNREEVPDGVISLVSGSGLGGTPSGTGPSPGTGAGRSRSGATNSGLTSAQTPGRGRGANSGTPVDVAMPSPAPAVAPASSKGGLIIAIVLGLVIIGGGGFVLAKTVFKKDVATVTPPMPEKPMTPPETPKAAEQMVTLDSNPTGAEVTDGPKLLGTTPLKIRLDDKKPTMAVRLAKSGFEDLPYTVSATDGPSITLKMVATKVKKSSSGGNKSKADGSGKPKVKTFEDDDSAAMVPTFGK